METASTEVMSIWRRNDIEKSTWRTHRYFVDFESRIHVEISTSNRCHNFHVDSPFKIDIICMNFPRGISTLNGWRLDEDVSIGSNMCSGKPVCRNNVCSSKSICRNKVFQSKPTNVTILRCKHVLTDHSYYVDSSKSTAICFFLSILIFSLHYEFCIITMNIFY